ncbi:hypothetical protein OIU34_19910 [Pararhizobium sp. BT-229]|uniref:hypothetical protein n=1 Tax=Pararhizobium sp. BT-229 TaxID=2986923 RepID=UPI0021F74C36|nr:hypothetical protein [Pararhizobium sp. BT-229]MCV9964152.1 hypothetical protein [Pararhizobium sp. BT-229]
MSDVAWRMVPVDPTEDMISSATGLRPGCGGYGDISSRCVRDWNAMLKAAPHAPSLATRPSGLAVTVEELARHLFETDDPDAEELSWPEHDDDDGDRGNGGWVKVVPDMLADDYRTRAAGLLRFMGCEV